jgi:hypothetical protein
MIVLMIWINSYKWSPETIATIWNCEGIYILEIRLFAFKHA